MHIGFAVLGVITTLCALIAGACAVTLRLGMFIFGDQKFSITDDSSKLCGAIAGTLFGLFLVLWIKIPHHNKEEQS